MSLTNAMGWMMLDWGAPHAKTRFVVYTIVILLGYVFVWFYWQGRNWARISDLLCSALAVVNLAAWNTTKAGTVPQLRHVMIACEAALGLFLLYWLNTSVARQYFKNSS